MGNTRRHKTSFKGYALLGGWCCVALLMIGCDQGPRLRQVEGKVTLDGSPLAGATVIFQPEDGGPASHAETDQAGHFELSFADGQPGAVVGTHTVTVETYRISVDDNGEPVEHPELLPARYNAETELVREVEAGTQRVDFPLERE